MPEMIFFWRGKGEKKKSCRGGRQVQNAEKKIERKGSPVLGEEKKRGGGEPAFSRVSGKKKRASPTALGNGAQYMGEKGRRILKRNAGGRMAHALIRGI